MRSRRRTMTAALLGALAALALAGPAHALVVGDKAPDFTLPAPGGKQVKLTDKNGVVRWMKIQDNALDLLKPEEILQALKQVGG